MRPEIRIGLLNIDMAFPSNPEWYTEMPFRSQCLTTAA